MTPRERATLRARFPWVNIAEGLAGLAVGVVVASAIVGLPLLLVLLVAGVSDAWEWVKLVLGLIAAMWAIPMAIAVLGEYLRERHLLSLARDANVVDDRELRVNGCIEVDFESFGVIGYYLRETSGAITLLVGDYLRPLARGGVFPSTTLRLVRLHGSGRVIGLMPLGEPLAPLLIDGQQGLQPAGDDGQQVEVNFEALVALAVPQSGR